MIPAELLAQLPLLADGCPRDALARRHPGLAGPVEALNLRRPEWPRALHEEFRKAGARVLRTNTSQANPVSLARDALEERCEAINNSGSALARAAAGQEALVMGTIGEISGVPASEREQAYGRQAVYLGDTGADFLLLDGFSSVAEALLARRAARDAGDAPVMALLLAGAAGLDVGEVPASEAARRLADGGVDAVGLLTHVGGPDPRPVLDALAPGGLPLAVFLEAAPGAAMAPEHYADRLAALAGHGPILLGGGAGIAPEHVRALVQRLARDEALR